MQQIAAAAWATEAGPIGLPKHAAQSEPKDDKRDALAKAHWIWHRESDTATPPPPGKRYFRYEFTLPEAAVIRSGRMVLTADNTFALYVNGSLAKTGDNLSELYSVDVTPLLIPGTNVLAVAAENKGNQPNAAGLVGALSVKLDDGREIAVATDAVWLTSTDVGESWTRAAAPGNWVAAHDLGLFGVAPWEDVGKKAIRIDPYPESSQIEQLLKDMGVFPDFAADADLAYIHRQIGTSDVYFVSNGSQDSIEAACTFRVSGMKAELWHPETGRKRNITHVSSSPDGRTVLPLRFEPAESYFVVFSPVESNSPKHTESVDFPALKSVMEVSGPWNVSFDPRNGGPDATAIFDVLTDWSQHPEDSIRYYSGAADYSKAIEIPAEILNQGRPLYLDLGRVEVMASVRLNGKELGIAWKRPFRVAIGDAAKPGSNDLEIRVVNLWPNRMIGDEHLPQDSDRNTNGTLKQWPQWMLENKPSPAGRYTLATWQHWSKDDPLLSSGLLGPIDLLMEE